MRGKAKISDNWSSGFNIEIEDEGQLSKFLNQFNDNVDNGSLNVRRSAIYLDNKKLGRVWLGQWSTAKDDITKDNIVIKGLDQTMHADFYMNWSFFLRQKGFNNAEAFSSSTPRFQDIGRCYSTSSSAFDCSTRRQEIRYDTPDWYGFVASWAWGEDDVWSAALRYNKEWDNWKIGAGYAYENPTDEKRTTAAVGSSRASGRLQGMGRLIFNHAQANGLLFGANSNRRTMISVPKACSPRRPSCMPGTSVVSMALPERSRSGFVGRLPSGRLYEDRDGLGGFTRTTVSHAVGHSVLHSVWMVRSAGAFRASFATEITSSETINGNCRIRRSIGSLNLSSPSASSRRSNSDSTDRVPITLDDFDVLLWVAHSVLISASLPGRHKRLRRSCAFSPAGCFSICAVATELMNFNLWLCGHRAWQTVEILQP
jgi:hypothetical protein